MKAKQIKEGDRYHARVSGKLVIVRVDKIRDLYTAGAGDQRRWGRGGQVRIVYDVTNLTTNQTTTFRSAAKFRSEVVQLPATAGR